MKNGSIYMTMMLTSLSANIAIFRAIISKEVHDMLNWVRANKKLMNAGELKEERLTKFKELLALAEEYKRKNQYQ